MTPADWPNINYAWSGLLVEELARLEGGLMLRRLALADPVLPMVEGTPEAEVLARQRARYTMQAERAIHDGVIGAGLAPVVAPQEAVAEETLDDILF